MTRRSKSARAVTGWRFIQEMRAQNGLDDVAGDIRQALPRPALQARARFGQCRRGRPGAPPGRAAARRPAPPSQRCMGVFGREGHRCDVLEWVQGLNRSCDGWQSTVERGRRVRPWMAVTGRATATAAAVGAGRGPAGPAVVCRCRMSKQCGLSGRPWTAATGIAAAAAVV